MDKGVPMASKLTPSTHGHAPGPGVSLWVGRGPLLVLAAATLLLGALLYAADRSLSHASLLPAFATLTIGPLFGPLGGSLPSFLHPFAFSLLSAAAGRLDRSTGYGACAGWWLVNIAFEAGQQPALREPIVGWMGDTLGTGRLTTWLTSYLLHGTFDVADLLAASLGSLTAAAVLWNRHRLENCHVRESNR